MKFFFIMTVGMLLPFSLAPMAAAEPIQAGNPAAWLSQRSLAGQPTQLRTDPQLETGLETVPRRNSFEPLSVEQDSEQVSASERSEHLTDQAQQINQSLESRQNRGPQLRDLVDLPEGMIIRGSSRGGIGIGTEY